MRLTQAGISGVAALLGTTMTETQLAWIAKAPAVLLLMDADQPGRKAAKTIAQALDHHNTVLIHNLPAGKEPEDLEDANLLSIVANAIPFSLNPPSPVHGGTERL
jgi:DNA primase